MQTDRSPRSTILTLAAVAALVASACSTSGKPAPSDGPSSVVPSTARPAPSAAPDGVLPGVLLAVGRAGETDLRIVESRVGQSVMTMPIGAPDASWGHILNVTPDGNGHARPEPDLRRGHRARDRARRPVASCRRSAATQSRRAAPSTIRRSRSSERTVPATAPRRRLAFRDPSSRALARGRAAHARSDDRAQGRLRLRRPVPERLDPVRRPAARRGHRPLPGPLDPGCHRRDGRCGRGRQAEHRRDDGGRPDHPAATGRRERDDALPRAGAPLRP